ncbi:MAG: hypothetical protein ACJAXH_003225 [Colwellia sp.]
MLSYLILKIDKDIVMIKVVLFILSMILVNKTLAGTVYKCTVDGVIKYSQMPCGDGEPEKVIILDVMSNSIKSPQKQPQSTTSNNDYIIKSHIISNKIKRSEANIKKYQKKMVRELNVLKARTYSANNNLAGAIYQDALSTEMLAVTNKYQSLIDTSTTNINKLKSKINDLKN